MNFLSQNAEPIAVFFGMVFAYIGLGVMVFGVLKALVMMLWRIVDRSIVLGRVRLDLGRYLVLSLEFLVAKDILESIFNPSFELLLRLFVIVVIRTILSYFLNKELTEIKQEIQEEIREVQQKQKIARARRKL